MTTIKEIFETTEELHQYQPMPLDKIRKLEIAEVVEVALFDCRGNFLTVEGVVICARDGNSTCFPVQVSLADVSKEILRKMEIPSTLRWVLHSGNAEPNVNFVQAAIVLERKGQENVETENSKAPEKSYILAYGDIWENIQCDNLPEDAVLGLNPKTGQFQIWYLDRDVMILDSATIKQIKAL